jgi:hypothetical protein
MGEIKRKRYKERIRTLYKNSTIPIIPNGARWQWAEYSIHSKRVTIGN